MAISRRRGSSRLPLLSAGRCGYSLSRWRGATPMTAKTPISMRRAFAKPGPRCWACFEIRCSSRICALLTLWSFNPVWGSVLYLHMTEGLGFSEQDFGNVTSAFFAGSLIGSIGYGIYCRSVRLSTLLHLSILAAIVSNAVYWQLGSLTSAYGISVLAGAAYMTGTLIQLDLIARIIPPRAAATLFAIVMALTNFAGSASEAFGGWLFEAAKLQGRDGFSTVVAISVAFAASCWLLVPMLRRAAPQWWQ